LRIARAYELIDEQWGLVADLFDPPGRRVAREAAGRDPEASMVMVEWQAIQGRRAGPGFHAKGGKFGRTKGTKRAVLIDVVGLPVAPLADAASNDDTLLVGRLLDPKAGQLPRLQLVLGDRGFRNLAHRAAREHGVIFEVRY